VQNELAESALKQRVLGHELQHRINNILATIRAVARRTLARSESLSRFATAFDQRLAAIARTHMLLSRSEAAEAGLGELLGLELAAHGGTEGETITLHGPEIRLPGPQAQVLAMAFHELATNAVKYGALAAKGGHIDVSWDIDDTDHVRVVWRESGVTIPGDPSRRGFGSDILEKSIPHMLHGSFERAFGPDGIECIIAFALERKRERDDGRPDRR
jgi:two-component sensor histidine kinase